MTVLNKDSLSEITGGLFSTCVAGCDMNEDGSFNSYVMCGLANSSCSAVDEEGCTDALGFYPCGGPPEHH